MPPLDLIRNASLADLGVRPMPETSEGAAPPDNSEIRKAAEAVLGGVKMSFAAIAANPDRATERGTVEDAMRSAIKGLPATRRDDIAATARQLLDVPEAQRVATFGIAGTRDADSHLASGGIARFTDTVDMPQLDAKLLGVRTDLVPVAVTGLRSVADGLLIPAANVSGNVTDFEAAREETNAAAEAADLYNPDRLTDIWGARVAGDPFSGGLSDDDFEQFATTDKMGFWIQRVRCVDETNPEWFGSDEIALAGVSVDEDGDTHKRAEQYIGGGFDDGDQKTYANWRYTSFSMTEGKYWPKRYSVSLILAEKDNGGLSSFLNDIWSSVRAQVKAAIAKAVAAGIGGWTGAAIATALGKAVAWIIDVFVGWIIGRFKDNIFPVFTASVTTPSMSARWSYPNGRWGNPSSGTRTAHFYGHGGHYLIDYRWQFFA